MKSELDALIAKYEEKQKGAYEDSYIIDFVIDDLKALRDKCDNNKSGSGVYC